MTHTQYDWRRRNTGILRIAPVVQNLKVTPAAVKAAVSLPLVLFNNS